MGKCEARVGLGLGEVPALLSAEGVWVLLEVFGEWRHLATGSLYDSLVARYDMVDEGLHIPFRTRRG